jgi:hypothetical protein
MLESVLTGERPPRGEAVLSLMGRRWEQDKQLNMPHLRKLP